MTALLAPLGKVALFLFAVGVLWWWAKSDRE